MKLKIKLLSDLCTGSGDIFNSAVDTDVVYDSYGLPYIPAKRLKGCIREAYLELEEFGVFQEGSCALLFGKEGSSPSQFTLSNAYLENYEDICSALDSEDDEVLKHPQNVLALYTYTRKQTAMNSESGAAEKNTLRTMRVVKHGLIFEAEIDYYGDTQNQEFKNLLAAAKCVSHIGIGRSRGLGLVKITVDETSGSSKVTVPDKKDILVNSKNGRSSLSYTITLNAPMLCKSPEGNQAKSQPYIEGSKMLGLIAGALGKDKFHELIREDKKFIVTNAYITAGNERCTPIRASWRREKDASFDEKGELIVHDMLEQRTQKTAVQTSAAPAQFVSRGLAAQNVNMDINYHHRRPEDKSIGRANGKDQSSFYQLESIRRGQIFKGFILASEQQAEEIVDVLKKQKNIRMGYGRSAEYGAVSIHLKCEPFADVLSDEKIHEFTFKLNSPAILYNRYGMLSADVQVLKEYLGKLLEVDDLKIERAFLNYQTIGGFQVTWKKRKPVFTALGQGSVCLFSSESGADLSKLEGTFIGERTREGFGEIEVDTDMPSDQILHQYKEKKTAIKPEKDAPKADKSKTGMDIIHDLYLLQAKSYLKAEARIQANRVYELCRNNRETDATLSRVMMICRTEKNYSAAKDQVDGIESDSKKSLAQTILEECNPDSKQYNLQQWKGKISIDEQEIFQIISDAYLKQLKYKLRPEKEERRQ